MALPKNYYNYFDICRKEGVNANTAKTRIGESGVEGIKHISQLQPIAHLFRVFPKGMRHEYGILRTHYDYFKEHGEPPKVSTGRPPKWKGNPDYTRLDVPIRKSTKERFEKGRKKANSMSVQQVTQSEITELAILEYMDRHVNIFGVDTVDETKL